MAVCGGAGSIAVGDGALTRGSGDRRGRGRRCARRRVCGSRAIARDSGSSGATPAQSRRPRGRPTAMARTRPTTNVRRRAAGRLCCDQPGAVPPLPPRRDSLIAAACTMVCASSSGRTKRHAWMQAARRVEEALGEDAPCSARRREGRKRERELLHVAEYAPRDRASAVLVTIAAISAGIGACVRRSGASSVTIAAASCVGEPIQGGRPCEELVEDDAERPDVRARVDRAPTSAPAPATCTSPCR